MVSTILIALGLPILISLFINWRAIVWYVFQSGNLYLGRRITYVVPLALVCIATYCSAPLFEYLLLLAWSYALIALVERLTEGFLCFSFIVLFLLVTYVQFFSIVGYDVILTLNRALVWFLREYRWKRFIMHCLRDDRHARFTSASEVVLYIADWVHYRIAGDWKEVVLLEFQAQHYPGPQPTTYDQLERRFIGELQVVAGARTSGNPLVGMAAEHIIAIACGHV
ncbi:uncharacterized protein GGS22DRAFT_185656 [Annulohypoxylon maeteangense]|uniref:uncharacterized protein n=1 Tax=Annulohypoxylon maeteangense TaxID=1927788 RepID=UPI0020074DBD|nr:uncharacterized protein GGS22DRAFT_185656 [Annulohypoxylon maeteangense]KAI0888278.1 hypothetical protein GGS22DRAFT_185656 [Annulohypoxylon maeteangense]